MAIIIIPEHKPHRQASFLLDGNVLKINFNNTTVNVQSSEPHSDGRHSSSLAHLIYNKLQ